MTKKKTEKKAKVEISITLSNEFLNLIKSADFLGDLEKVMKKGEKSGGKKEVRKRGSSKSKKKRSA